MLYRRFEKLIDVFRDAPTAAPPDRVLPFYTYYLKQVWPSFAALLLVGLVGALIEVALFSYLSRIIDLAQANRARRKASARRGWAFHWVKVRGSSRTLPVPTSRRLPTCIASTLPAGKYDGPRWCGCASGSSSVDKPSCKYSCLDPAVHRVVINIIKRNTA